MSNNIIPKEQLSAYQRWELTALEENKSAGARLGQTGLPTAEQLQQIQLQAHQEGYAAGHQEGRQTAVAEAERMQQLLVGVSDALNQFDQQIARDLLALALSIAKQMVRHTLQVKPEVMLEVVREAMNGLPLNSQHPHLILHPADAELVRTVMEPEFAHSPWKIIEDARIERGGCRIETIHSEIDASLETRWQRIVAALGGADAWQE